MKLETHFIGSRHIEVKVDEIDTGTMNAKEARELARNLIEVAAELLSIGDGL